VGSIWGGGSNNKNFIELVFKNGNQTNGEYIRLGELDLRLKRKEFRGISKLWAI
jgi:hypothetical protein